MIPAILYAAKSTEDKRGSLDRQLADCRQMAEEKGWAIQGEYQDEGFSAYSGNRGPGLAAARDHAARIAVETGEVAYLLVQHSDRISRGGGDKPNAAEALIEIWHAERRRNVHLRSVEDDYDLQTSASVANIGERNRAHAARISKGTSDGLRDRQARGDPVGPVLLGYRVEKEIVQGQVISRRAEDPEYSPVMERAFKGIDQCDSPGAICRTFNNEGLRNRPRGGKPGQPFTPRRLRDTLRNRGYLGENGYPRMPWMTDELFERVQARLAERARGSFQRLGGPEPKESYLLRGLCRCGYCNAPLYIRSEQGQARKYICRNVRLHTGICDAVPIRADVLESAVVAKLGSLVGDVEEWITERLEAQQHERERLRQVRDHAGDQVEQVERRIQKAQHHYDRALDDDDEDEARAALQQLARLNEDRDERLRAVAEADARVEEWSGEPDPYAARRWLEDVLKQVEGRIARAEGADAVRTALRAAIADVSVSEVLDNDDRRHLLIAVTLHGHDLPTMALGGHPDEVREGIPAALLGAKGSCTTTR